MPTNKKSQEKHKRSNYSSFIKWFYLIIFIGFFLLWTFSKSNYSQEITWKQFESEILAANDVAKLVVVNNERVDVYIKPESFSKEKYEEELPKE